MKWIDESLKIESAECLTWPFNTCGLSGHAQMTISRKTVNPARVICEKIFGPAPSPKHEAAHSCGNGDLACVNWKHVRWATHKENEADKRAHGTAPIGEKHGAAKLTEQQVRQIRASKDSSYKACKKFGVSNSMICRIRRREAWTHVL
jgi:hypothetical protein